MPELTHCTAQPAEHAHLFKPTRGPARPDAPEDQEQCSMCNAIRQVPFEEVTPSWYEGGCGLYRRRNLLIGGFDYYGTELGAVTKIVDASTSLAELEAVLEVMRKGS